MKANLKNRNVWTAIVTRGGVVGSNFVSMLAIGAMTAPETYGTFVLLWSLSLMLSACISFGAPQYLLKEMAICNGVEFFDSKLALRLIVLFPAIATVVLALVFFLINGRSSLLPANFGKVSTELILLIASLGYVINLNNCVSSLLHGLNLMNISMFLKDAGPQFFALVTTTFLYLTTEIKLFPILLGTTVMLSLSVTLGILMFLSQNRQARLIAHHGKVQSFSLYYWGGTITGIFWTQIDILIGASFMTAQQLGIYNIIRRICNLITLPLSISTWLTVGKFARAFDTQDTNSLHDNLRFSLVLSNGLGALLTGVVIVMILPIQNFYGFPDGIRYIPIWAILIFQAFVNLLFAPSTTMANTSGLERSVMMSRIIGSFVYVVLLYLLSLWIENALLNAIALLLGTLALNFHVWSRIFLVLKIDSSVWSLVNRRSIS